ncbi:MAG: hypothetical protein AAF665_04970 [Pseudomonadota bacterium]
MRAWVFKIAMISVLAGCGPVPLYYKTNASVSRLHSDLLSCEVSALKDAPVATQVRQGPPRYVPARHYCRSDGHCHSSGGYFVHGAIYSVDVNARLRNDLEQQCMGAKGYQLLELPRCSNSAVVQASQLPSTSDPTARTQQLTPTSCAALDDDGRWRILDTAS